MTPLALHSWHERRRAAFGQVAGAEAVLDYGEVASEYEALRARAALLDFSFRGRLCVLGPDRIKFLNGQVTNDVARLAVGGGCYAALVNAKGKFESDLFIYRLAEELLLDFEPGLSTAIAARLEKFVVAEDVQVVDVAPHYGLLSVQGPESRAAMARLMPDTVLPANDYGWTSVVRDAGELYVTRNPRLGTEGYDVFVPTAALEEWAEQAAAADITLAGWSAFEMARIEAGIPRFGADMDGSNLPPETGIQERAISYAKGCYIGQEIIARIRTYGQVAKSLRRLRLEGAGVPDRGTKLFSATGVEAGYVTSAVRLPGGEVAALGYVRRAAGAAEAPLHLGSKDGAAVRVMG